MYWPIGTPTVFATASAQPHQPKYLSHDGIEQQQPAPDEADPASVPSSAGLSRSSTFDNLSHKPPLTPLTPAVRPVDDVDYSVADALRAQSPAPTHPSTLVPSAVPTTEPILGLKLSRNGELFATITPTSIAVWQTKPTVILAVAVRSDKSLATYGLNTTLLLRPDSAILVVQTTGGYLITYSLASDPDAFVYRAHFASHHNVQRRRQSYANAQHNGSGSGGAAAAAAAVVATTPDEIMWGPGEGNGVRDVSICFRMVIKLDAGVQAAVALEHELIVATKKPPAVQCIRWTPDQSGHQTSTELLSRVPWIDRKVTVCDMVHDRPMNLSAWTASDGKVYAVQRIVLLPSPSTDAVTIPGAAAQPVTGANAISGSGSDPDPTQNGRPRLFNGFCFHTPTTAEERAVRVAINAKFSLIAVGCASGRIHVYFARDYAGNIPPSHQHVPPVSLGLSGQLTSLQYTPDGYCLFAGYENGWAIFSVFGAVQSHSFGSGSRNRYSEPEQWLSGVVETGWVGASPELLMVNGRSETIWMLQMARSAVVGCYNPTNIFRTVLQTTSDIMVYRGYDLPDLKTISAEPFLWHHAQVPPSYLMHQWPIRCAVVSPNGRYIAVAGRRGLAHYSVNSGRWKVFDDKMLENEFQVRGGMCWHQHILVASVEADKSFEIRLYPRESLLDRNTVVHRQQLPAPVVLVTQTGDDSLLVYTYENTLYHFVFAATDHAVELVQVGQVTFQGIIRSPARVRGVSWILPESQLLDGDPSRDVAVASVLFLVDGNLVMLQPSLNPEGNLKYDMKLIAQSVEYYVCMSDKPFTEGRPATSSGRSPTPTLPLALTDKPLDGSLWIYDGGVLKVWPEFQEVIDSASAHDSHQKRSLSAAVSIPLDFYPLSILMEKALVLGVEAELIQRRDVNFSFFHFSIRSHLFLPHIFRFYLTRNNRSEALTLARHYQGLEYFSHALEMLLHQVLDDEVDTAPPPHEAVLPRVLSLLSSFRDYLDIVVQCTRKTEVRSWRTLFAYLPPPQELFEESLLRGALKTAGGYLLILHALDERNSASASEHSVRLLARAMRATDWELCRELARFLAAMDESGDTLRSAMEMVKREMNVSGDVGVGAGIGDFSLLMTGMSPSGKVENGSPSDGVPSDGGSNGA